MTQSRYKLISFFAALCLFLSAIEYAIPKPLPFLRLGLANLPIILSLEKMTQKETVLLVLLKVLGQGIITGTIFSYVFLFSLAGSVASAGTMLVLFALFGQRKHISAVGLSLAGALANTLAQLLVSRWILFGQQTRYIAPVLLCTGMITGLALGVFTELFKQKSHWFAALPSAKEVQT